MKIRVQNLFVALALLALLSTINSQLSTLHAQGTAFSYSGQLQNNGSPASGTYNLTFSLFNTNAGGTAIAEPITNNAVVITNGLFTVLIDFGAGVWNGQTNWLQIGVESNGISGFTPLSPRQELTPAPYAIYAENAGGLPGLSVQQNTNGAPNLIGGSPANFVSGGVVGATISGGGDTNYGGIAFINSVTGNFGTVGGGANNTAGFVATVGGGAYNTASGDQAVVGGGANNTASGQYATVGGGYQNTASGELATVGGGYENTNSGELATVGGGVLNTASGISSFVGGGGYDGSTFRANNALGNASVIVGGLGNFIPSGGTYAFIGGGAFNTASGELATVGGGSANTASGIGSFVGGGGFDGTTTNGNSAVGNASVIGGGWGNTNSAIYAAIGGGYQNFIQPGDAAVIGGGSQNVVESNSYEATIAGGWTNVIGTNANQATIGGGLHNTAGGYYATVPGGANNLAGGTLSFAAGDNAQATNTGAFVWSDGTGTLTTSTNNNSVTMRASGGYRLFSSTANTTYAFLAAGSGSWTSLSDRNAKEHFQAVNPLDVLERVAVLPVSTWNYKTQPASVRHIGPTAQDFKAAFTVGETDTGISTVDEGGVALAAIQGLNQKLNEKDAEIQDLKRQNDLLARQLNQLEMMVNSLADRK